MTPLWPHQTRALEAIEARDAVMVHYGMGTGKSRLIVEYIRRHAPARVLILCPLSVCQVWPYQIEKHGVETRPLVLDRGLIRVKATRIAPYLAAQEARGEPGIVVVNYDSAWRGELGKTLSRIFWDLSVCDESHRIKSSTSKITRFCHLKLRSVSKKRVAMTGTLLPHSPLDIVGQYSFLDPSIFGPWKMGFLRRYAVMGGYEDRQVVRWENADELREKIALLELRARLEDVLSLPSAQHVKLPVTLPSKALSIYRALEDEFLAEVDAGTITAANAMVKLLRLQQVTGGATKTEDGRTAEIHREKESALSDLLESADPSEPIVVFARFHSDLDQTIRAAKDRGGVLELSGRRNELQAWQDGKARVLAVQIQAGGVGVDLTRARIAVYYSLGFSLGEYEQSLARIHRPGQERPVLYYHLIAQGTVDEKVYEALRKKRDVVNFILDGRTHDSERRDGSEERSGDRAPAEPGARARA